MDPSSTIHALADMLPDNSLVRDIVTLIGIAASLLTAIGKSLDVIVPALRQLADWTVNRKDDEIVDKIEAFANGLAHVNAKIPRGTIGTTNDAARPIQRAKKSSGSNPPSAPLMMVVFALLAGIALAGCKNSTTQRTLNVSGESLYALDDQLAPWMTARRDRCLEKVEAMPASVSVDYEGEYRSCMAIPNGIFAAMATLRAALREANDALDSYGRNDEEIGCEIIGRVSSAASVLVDRLNSARDLGLPEGVVETAGAFINIGCNAIVERNEQ